MWLLNVLAVVMLYAFIVPYVWLFGSFVIAAFRVRKTPLRSHFRGLLGHAFSSLAYAFWPGYMLNLLRDDSEWWYQAMWYVLAFLYPVILVLRYRLTNKVIPLWRKVGYADLKELLLFRAPSAEPLADDAVLPEITGPADRPILWITAGLSLCLVGLSFLGLGLRTCQWLDISTGRSGCLRTMPLKDAADEIALSPDGRVMAMRSGHEPLKLYNVVDGTILRELPNQHPRCGRSASFSPDNQWVATISSEDAVTISNVQTGVLIHALEVVTSTNGIKFSPDGKYLAVGLARGGLQVWRTSDWKLHWVIPVPIGSISFSANGRWLAAQTLDDRVGIWQMADGTVYRTINAPAYHLAFSPDESQLATADLLGPIKIWDVSSGQLIRIINVDTRGEILYSFDGQYLLADESYSTVMSSVDQLSVWRVTDGQQVTTLPAYWSIACAAHAAKSNVFAYSDRKSLKIFRLRQN